MLLMYNTSVNSKNLTIDIYTKMLTPLECLVYIFTITLNIGVFEGAMGAILYPLTLFCVIYTCQF